MRFAKLERTSPHVAGLTRESNQRVSAMVADRVAAALSKMSKD